MDSLRGRLLRPLFLAFLMAIPPISFSQIQTAVVGNSTIGGRVTDRNNSPIAEIDVELLNDYYRTVGRVRTDATGRYEFSGIGDGRYTIKINGLWYDSEDVNEMVEINTLTIRGTQGSEYKAVDLILIPRKGGFAEASLGVVFAQEVPKEAKKTYDLALRDLNAKNRKEGILKLEQAIKAFPDYFDALFKISEELIKLNQYENAAQFLLKATQVNPKNPKVFYFLGYCFVKMGPDYHNAAIASYDEALILAPNSQAILLERGKLARQDKDFKAAESFLLKAKKAGASYSELHKELAMLYGNDLKKFDLAADELELYLKSNKVNKEEEKQIKKQISSLREKAKIQTPAS